MPSPRSHKATKATSGPRSSPSRSMVAGPEMSHGRIMVAIAAFGLVSLALCFQLGIYQIVDHAWLSARAETLTQSGPSQATRGFIYDDANNVLAISDTSYQVLASPVEIHNPWWLAGKLRPLLHMRQSHLAHLLSLKASNVVVASNVPQNVAIKIGSKNWLGIALGPNPNRVYPEGSLASQLLGFTEPRSAGVLDGQYGVEQRYNDLLNGAWSTQQFMHWAYGAHFHVHEASGASAGQTLDIGATLHLSIDTYTQDVVEQLLRARVKATGASSGTIIVTEPKTGKIIALANYPWFNPNTYFKSKLWNLSDSAIDYTYEPGSTFKIITMAAGLNAHVITPTSELYDPGYAYYPQCSNVPIHNWNYPVSNGEETMIQVLQHSANVGAAHVASLLGIHRFYHYVKKFGVGRPTGVDLAGEADGILPLPNQPHTDWTCLNLYDNAFGQSLSVTTLQLLTAVNAVANRGVMMRPSVVNSVDYHGYVADRRPHRIRRVISRASARTLTSMLVQSAMGPPGEYGEAACALVPGYEIAAKTGTANLTVPGSTTYMKGPGSTIASTVGYAPAFHPRFSVIVAIRKPRVNWALTQWGSTTAAPVVHDVFSSLFLHFHIPPAVKNSARVQGSQTAFGGCSF